MSAPLIWIVFPFLVGLYLIFISYWFPTANIIGVIIAIILFVLAIKLPLTESISVLGVPGVPDDATGNGCWVHEASYRETYR